MRNRDAYRIYLLIEAATSLFFFIIVTVNSVYQVEVAKLNPLQLVLVGTVLEGTVFLCQIPTGVVADVFSRRLSVITGMFLIGVGFVLEGSIARFETILVAQVLWGLGYTFVSGAEEAWIADEVGEDNVGQIYLRGSQLGLVGALVGAIVSVILASIQINLPIVLGGAFYIVLGGFLVFVMPEHNFRPTAREERSTWQAMGDTLLNGGRLVRRSPVLITILVIAGFYGMASEGFDRLSAAHFLMNFQFPSLGQFKPVVWFGIISIGGRILSIGATEVVRRRLDTTNHLAIARVLFGMNVLLIASVVTFGLAENFPVALAAFWGASVLRSMDTPIYTAWLAQSIDPKVRATVLSMSGQVDALGQIAGGPAIGVIGNLVSIRAAIVASGAVLSPVLVLFVRTMRHSES